MAGSTSAFNFAQICADLPCFAFSISASISSPSRTRSVSGATAIFSRLAGLA